MWRLFTFGGEFLLTYHIHGNALSTWNISNALSSESFWQFWNLSGGAIHAVLPTPKLRKIFPWAKHGRVQSSMGFWRVTVIERWTRWNKRESYCWRKNNSNRGTQRQSIMSRCILQYNIKGFNWSSYHCTVTANSASNPSHPSFKCT